MAVASRPSMRDSRLGLAHLLTVTAVGLYLLLVVGATTSLTDAVSACSTWPTCSAPTDPLSQIDLAIAWAHRLLAIAVGLLVTATTVRAFRDGAEDRVRWLLVGALAVFLLQIGIGALTATNGPAAVLPGLHLTLGVLVFIGTVLALAWQLEATTGTPDETPIERDHPEPVDESPTVPTPSGSIDRLKLTGLAYLRLTKPRLMWLLCLVAAAGMALAAGPALELSTVLATLTGGVLAIGASGTFNHVLERDIDRRMQRTSDRPLATDYVPVRNAVAFGLLLAIASVAIFYSINALAAALGLVAILFYSVIYTLVLKPNTVQNTVIGGFAGALPALIGWAAVTETIGLPAILLAGVIFLWTPAHFYNLALAYKDDYARGGFPMMPVVRGETTTRKHIVYYLGATLVGAVALAWLSDLGVVYAVTAAAFGALFLWLAVRLHLEQTEAAAIRSFHASNAFLGAILFAVVLDALVI